MNPAQLTTLITRSVHLQGDYFPLMAETDKTSRAWIKSAKLLSFSRNWCLTIHFYSFKTVYFGVVCYTTIYNWLIRYSCWISVLIHIVSMKYVCNLYIDMYILCMDINIFMKTECGERDRARVKVRKTVCNFEKLVFHLSFKIPIGNRGNSNSRFRLKMCCSVSLSK